MGTGAQVASGGVSAYGQMAAARAQSQALDYNAQIQDRNVEIAEQNATWAAQEGDQAVSQSQMKTRALYGATKANQGASGVRLDSGSDVEVRASEVQTGMQDALTIRSNAARKAYGFETQAAGAEAQAQLDRAQSKNAITSGTISAGGTILGSLAKASQYSSFLKGNSILDTGSVISDSSTADEVLPWASEAAMLSV